MSNWVSLPVEPTREMLSALAGHPALLAASVEESAREAYKAMLSAAPLAEIPQLFVADDAPAVIVDASGETILVACGPGDDKADAELAALIVALVNRPAAPLAATEWRPMESAPKDGTRILMWQKGRISEGYWRTDIPPHSSDGWGGDGWSYARHGWPTHWIPSPLPPLPGKEAA